MDEHLDGTSCTFLKSPWLYKNNRVQIILNAFKQFRTHSINFYRIYLSTFAHDQKRDFPQQNDIFEHIQIDWMCSILFEKHCMSSNFLMQNCSIYEDFKMKTLTPKNVQIPCNGSKIELCPLWQNWKIDKMVLGFPWLEFKNSFSQKA